MLLPSEARGQTAYSKCCAKGKVKLPEQFQDLQRRQPRLDYLIDPLNTSREAKSLRKSALPYNNEFAYGTISKMSKPAPGQIAPRVIRINGMITYQLSDINKPSGRLETCGQIYTLPPDLAIERRISRHFGKDVPQRNQLDVSVRIYSFV